MKVIILAAGTGSRLTDSVLPKPLTTLANGQSILELQLENISHYISLHHVIVVVGYKKEMIKQRFPELNTIENPFFSEENTAKSLLCALKEFEEDILWMNGDVVFHYPVLQKVLSQQQTCMLVNRTGVGDEEVKYQTNIQGYITKVSKDVKNPEGEALGINFFKQEDLPSLKKHLAQCNKKDYFEKAIENCIQEEMLISSVCISTSECTEVDFPEDLKKANNLLATWKD